MVFVTFLFEVTCKDVIQITAGQTGLNYTDVKPTVNTFIM